MMTNCSFKLPDVVLTFACSQHYELVAAESCTYHIVVAAVTDDLSKTF